MNVLPRFASACRRHRAAREAPGGGSVSPVARCSCRGISLSRETDICIQRRIARTNVVKTAPREQSRKCFSGWRHGTVSGNEEIAEQWPRDREWCRERCQNQYSNTGIPLDPALAHSCVNFRVLPERSLRRDCESGLLLFFQRPALSPILKGF